MCWVHITKDERQKKPRDCSQKRRLARKRRSSQAITRVSCRWRSIARVSFPVLVSVVLCMRLSLCMFEFAGAASVARPLLRVTPQKGSQTLGMWEQTVHVDVHAQQRDDQQRQADAARQHDQRRREQERLKVGGGADGQAGRPTPIGPGARRLDREAE